MASRPAVKQHRRRLSTYSTSFLRRMASVSLTAELKMSSSLAGFLRRHQRGHSVEGTRPACPPCNRTAPAQWEFPVARDACR